MADFERFVYSILAKVMASGRNRPGRNQGREEPDCQVKLFGRLPEGDASD
jgi:hypothetical protein